jgi:hypothetical protein
MSTEKKRTGRPAGREANYPKTFRFRDEDERRLKLLKDTWGCSEAAVIRRLLLDAVKQGGLGEPEVRAMVVGSARSVRAGTEPATQEETDDIVSVDLDARQRRKQDETDIEEGTAHRPIWDVINEVMSQVPAEDLADLPTDLAEQHDHYIYGTPKR